MEKPIENEGESLKQPSKKRSRKNIHKQESSETQRDDFTLAEERRGVEDKASALLEGANKIPGAKVTTTGGEKAGCITTEVTFECDVPSLGTTCTVKIARLDVTADSLGPRIAVDVFDTAPGMKGDKLLSYHTVPKTGSYSIADAYWVEKPQGDISSGKWPQQKNLKDLLPGSERPYAAFHTKRASEGNEPAGHRAEKNPWGGHIGPE